MKKNFYPRVDRVYLKKKAVQKEYFKLIIKNLDNYKEPINLIDVTCESGNFLSLL